jgi:Protein of unknown function (DUF2723)
MVTALATPTAAILVARRAVVAAVGVGILALALCLWRLMPGVGFWDTAEFQMVLPVMGTAHPTGYPSYVLIGWLANLLLTPLGEPALRMNVLSAILVGVGAAFTTDLTRRVTGSIVLGVVAGVGTTLTPIVWAIGTHADPHALHFAFLAIILWLLVRWAELRRAADAGRDPASRDRSRAADRVLVAAAVVVGLSTGNHSLTLLLGLPILLYVLAVDPRILRRGRFIAACILAFGIPTVLVRFEMVLRAGWFRAPFVYADPSTWDGFWYVTGGQQFHDWFTNPWADWPRKLVDLADIAAGQLGPLAPLVVVAFVATAIRRPRYALLTGSTMALTCFFNSIYPDGAIDRYYIGPALIAWTWLAILAATVVDVVAAGGGAWAANDAGSPGRVGDARAAGIAGAASLAGLVIAAVVLLTPTLSALPTRAQIVDESNDTVAQRWTDDVLTAAEPDAVIVSWWSYSTTLWYATIVDGRRSDITIIDDRNRLDQNLGDLDQVIARYLPTRPVYLIRNGTSELPAVQAHYRIEPIGAAYASTVLRVLPLDAGASAVVPAGRQP